MKKLLSILSAFALVLAFVVTPVQAATITATATRTDANTIVVNLSGLTGNIAATDVFNISVRALDDGAAIDVAEGTTTATYDTTNGSPLAVTDFNTTGVTLTAGVLAGTSNKLITITDSAGPFVTTEDYVITIAVGTGSTQNVGDLSVATLIASTQNQITVSAVVEPILTMAVQGNVSFGTLTADALTAVAAGVTYNGSHDVSGVTSGTAITVNTNSASGYNLSVQNVGLISGGDQIPDTTAEEDLNTGYGYGIRVAAANGVAGTSEANKSFNGKKIDAVDSASVDLDTDFDATSTTYGAMSTTPAILTSAVNPVAGQTTVVEYGVRVSALQPTGNYTDTVTYTVTASF